MTKEDTFILSSIISPCCHAFNEFVSDTCICTECGRPIKKMDADEELTTSIVYNVDKKNTTPNMSSDLLEERRKKFSRNAHDITCALMNVKCPKCGGYCRMSRDQSNLKMLVCSSCRNVFIY